MNDKLAREIESYIGELRKNDPCAPLISSQRTGKYFSNTTLCMLFTGLYAQACMPNTLHAERRTFATNLNVKGVGMRTIHKLMGHQHIATTALYCDVSDE